MGCPETTGFSHTIRARNSCPLFPYSQQLLTSSMVDLENVAIFWDYENCRPSSNVSGCSLISNIRRAAHNFGSVKLFKAYLELSESSSSKSLNLRSELQSSGVSLTDCPHNGQKDVADKMILVDMLAYAIDNPVPSTIILISGDRDFAYAVSVLRLRRYRVVVMAPSVPSVHISLKSQASAFLDWNTEIMGRTIGDPSTSFCLSSCEPALSSSPRSPEFHPECCSSHSLALPLSLTTSCRISCGGQVPREGGGTFHDKASEVWLLDTVKQNMSLADHSLPPKSWSRSSDPSAGYASAAQTATAVKPESLERPTTAGNTPEWRQPSSQIGDPWIGRDNRAPQAQLFRASRGVSHAESQQFGSPVTSPTVQGDVSRILLTDMPSVSTSWTHCDNEDGLSTYSSYADQNAYGSSHASISRPIMSSILPTTPTPANSLAAIVDPTDIDQEHPLIVTIGSSSGLHIGPSEPAISREPVVPYKNDKNRTGRDPPGNRPANSIPSIFRILVEQLECLHASGIRRVPRTTLAVALTKQDKMIYEKAGVTTFRKYVSLAGKAGIVQLEADETGSSWISLHADWHRIPTES